MSGPAATTDAEPRDGAPDFPLSGLRVLDLSRVLAGPFAGRMFADLGADVVKVEPPDGDVSRFWGETRAGLSGFYTQQNAGKRDVCVSLAQTEGVEVIRQLAAQADVVIENFRPGVAGRLGIGWDDLRARNPRLVMLSISGYGQDEPDPPRGAFASIVHAASGLVERQARDDGTQPTDPMLAIADVVAGLHGMVAVLAALRLRDRTGSGQFIDMSMLDAMLATDDYAHHYIDASPVERNGGTLWQTKTGYVMTAGELKHIWGRISTAHGLSDGLPPDASLDEKIAARRQVLNGWFSSRVDAASVHAGLHAAGVIGCDVVSPHDVWMGQDVKRRNMIAEIDGRDGAMRAVVQSPYRFSAAVSGVRGPAPFRGEHNAEVLAEWVGLADNEIETLTSKQVLQAERTDD
jgi:CoA:oxalate CoA-transferase